MTIEQNSAPTETPIVTTQADIERQNKAADEFYAFQPYDEIPKDYMKKAAPNDDE